MGYTFILIVISLISIGFLILLKKKQQKSETLSFVSTLLATLFGVLLAVSLSNKENLKKEKTDTIKLLKSAKNIIDNTFDYTKGLGVYINAIKKDSTYTPSLINKVKLDNPIPYPDLMENIISNEVVSKNISEYSHNFIFSSLINLRKVANYSSINTYKYLLKELEFIVDLEIKYQQKIINESDLEKMYSKEKKLLEKEFPYSSKIVAD